MHCSCSMEVFGAVQDTEKPSLPKGYMQRGMYIVVSVRGSSKGTAAAWPAGFFPKTYFPNLGPL